MTKQLTNREVAEIVSRGTTDHGKTTCFYTGCGFALVKWPGGSYWSGLAGHSYCSPWVDRYEMFDVISQVRRQGGRNIPKVQVWNCARDKDGVLREKQKLELILREQERGLCEHCNRPLRDDGNCRTYDCDGER